MAIKLADDVRGLILLSLFAYGTLAAIVQFQSTGSLYGPYTVFESAQSAIFDPLFDLLFNWLQSAQAPKVWDLIDIHPLVDFPISLTYTALAVVIGIPLWIVLWLMSNLFFIGTGVLMIISAGIWGLSPIWIPVAFWVKHDS